MKKAYVLTLLIGLITLSGCYHYAPKSVKYNDVKYVNGWYQYSDKSKKDLHVYGIQYDENKEPLFKKNKYNFWFTGEFHFDFLYAEYEESQFWLPDVYVAESQLEEAKTYYRDKSNYDYFICKRFEDNTDVLIEEQNNRLLLDSFIDVIMEESKPKTIETKEDISINNLSCYRKSNDGLFTTHKEELVVYNQSIYPIKYYNGKTGATTLYDLEQKGKDLYTLFKNNNLIN